MHPRLRTACSLALLAVSAAFVAVAQKPSLTEAATVPGRYVVVYRDSPVPAAIAQHLAGVAQAVHLQQLGMSLVSFDPAHAEAEADALRRQPAVLAVLHDRIVQGHMPLRVIASSRKVVTPVPPLPIRIVSPFQGGPMPRPHSPLQRAVPVADPGYVSPAGWAVKQAGGFGQGFDGGATSGPWNLTLGAGVRIAILDSGVDATHPDIAPNLAFNLSEVDQTELPSVCDDGSPQDQQGHGTWVASLAAAAMGAGTGETVGVAPQATLLNIKVLERMPAAGLTPLAQCEAGLPSGLLSWVLTGINDAVTQHADVISLSLGSMVDLSTGDGAGWKAAFDRATYAADQAGVVIVAAAGNDGLNLAEGTFAELPAEARSVLAVIASTNPQCAENLASGATCAPGPIRRAYYSNYGGATLNAIAAPGGSYPEGGDIGVSGWVRGACSSGLPGTHDGLPAEGASLGCFGLGHVQYVQAIGTSASAPLVAGAAALLHAQRPDLTADGIVALLRGTATAAPGMAEPKLNLPAVLGMR